MCSECLPQVIDCPLWRARSPVWHRGRHLRHELASSQDTAPEDEERQTSGKFYELAKIIRGLGETERVLVVSPLKTMLDDVRKEMAKLGVKLAIVRGGAVEQQNTFKAWQTGEFKGLLSDPEIPALKTSARLALSSSCRLC